MKSPFSNIILESNVTFKLNSHVIVLLKDKVGEVEMNKNKVIVIGSTNVDKFLNVKKVSKTR